MKRHQIIWFLLIATVLASCGRPAVESGHAPSPPLSSIDSLMWRQPDSAFFLLQGFASNSEADSLDEFNGHYFQLLLSELLYKNDCAQTNRNDLLKAMDYFDSLVIADTRGVSLQGRNTFLNARAHYINGVGFCERGDAALACAEYLSAIAFVCST